MKEFTVGDMIKTLERLDPDLPIYDHFFDEDMGAECWFNVSKPTPKKQTIYLKPKKSGKTIIGEWSDQKVGGTILGQKKVVILYPPGKGEIEIG